jgi:hypothetical protein
MSGKLLRVALALMAMQGISCGVAASGADYTFHPVNAELKKGDDVPFEVRLLDKTGKPVAGAAIAHTRLDMAPEGMARHAAAVEPGKASEAGVYAFKANFSMTGRWRFSVAAKVPGEPETVMGRVIFTVK